MRFQFVCVVLFELCSSFVHISQPHHAGPSPLSVFSADWDDPKYLKCNTAAQTGYMNPKEKEIIYILNLMRTNPELFASSVVKQYPKYNYKPALETTPEYLSLLATLPKLQSMALLYPDSIYYNSAQCHAYTSGQTGYTGHERKDKNCLARQKYAGECCNYGNETPLSIVMTLLIDAGVESLGHRKICLGPYKKIGVSIQPHTEYRVNTVLDFGF